MSQPPRAALIAAGELVRLVELLLDAETPPAKHLAVIVLSRVRALLDGSGGEPAPLAEPAECLAKLRAMRLE